jgi:NTP pyrophosphatase (non-canonical NTP hydrolase)
MITNRQVVEFEAKKAVMDDFRRMLGHRIVEKGDKTFASRHEVLGVLTEEFQELVDAVKSNSMDSFEAELLDIMVGAFWGLCSLKNQSLDW